MESEYLYCDLFRKLNDNIAEQADALFSAKSKNIEEEASICITLLMSHNAITYPTGNTTGKIQSVLNRANAILKQLSPSLLKCQLLTYCYGEVFDPELATEAYVIINSWQGRSLSDEEQEIIDVLHTFETNPYNHWQEAI